MGEKDCLACIYEVGGQCEAEQCDVGTLSSWRPKDVVAHPMHYTSHPSGVECIQITEHMGFNLGCAMKYIWRCDLKHDAIEDLRKAIWYIEREIQKRVVKGESNE